jgi:hypothetical protein
LYSIFEDDRCVEDDKDKEGVPANRDPPRPSAISLNVSEPPPPNIDDPQQRQCVVNENATAPID